jgi:hypothetical protein
MPLSIFIINFCDLLTYHNPILTISTYSSNPWILLRYA